jgi:hypothetical protein
LSSDHPRPLEITPPTTRLNLAGKKEESHQNHEPPLGSGEGHLYMAGVDKKGGRQKQREGEQKSGGVGSVVSDQDCTEEEEKGKRGEQWAIRQDLTIPATISLTRR